MSLRCLPSSPTHGVFSLPLAAGTALAEYRTYRLKPSAAPPPSSTSPPPSSAAVLDIPHTFVPEALRGQGAAARLVEAVFEVAERKGLWVLPSCSYVEAWVAKREERWRGRCVGREEVDFLGEVGVDMSDVPRAAM
mmetsp:Transcript_13156/g.33362  ORF Transcript_13156/g.33362 Transcript_13156/m.33362 type:complete len:136 (+) Transcript_13156:533-940(+)